MVVRFGKLNVVAELNDPVIPAHDTNAGKLKDVKAPKLAPIAAVTVVKLVRVNEVSAANVGLNAPVITVNNGMLIVERRVPTGVNAPFIAVSAGRFNVVNAFAVNVHPPIMVRDVSVNVVSAFAVPVINVPTDP